MKQASSGGKIYKLGHRIIILKTSTMNLSQESPNKDRRGKMVIKVMPLKKWDTFQPQMFD